MVIGMTFLGIYHVFATYVVAYKCTYLFFSFNIAKVVPYGELLRERNRELLFLLVSATALGQTSKPESKTTTTPAKLFYVVGLIILFVLAPVCYLRYENSIKPSPVVNHSDIR